MLRVCFHQPALNMKSESTRRKMELNIGGWGWTVSGSGENGLDSKPWPPVPRRQVGNSQPTGHLHLAVPQSSLIELSIIQLAV